MLREEFKDYSNMDLRSDLLAGLTVASVSLPLAIAFGVASGATAAAGLVTAILAGLIIGLFSGASYQISGPTGAMSAVLLVVSQNHGLTSVLAAGAISGVLLLLLGYFRLGRFISFIPAPVIVGFTSGISLIIALGQLNNFFDIKTKAAQSALGAVINFFSEPLPPFSNSLVLGVLTILIISFWPKKYDLKLPAALSAIFLIGLLNYIFGLNCAVVGDIPKSLLLEDRLTLANLSQINLSELVFPVLAITALGGIESLLCGAVGSSMTGKRLYANQELIAQGIGNILIPFCGGVPATAAIARSSVAIKSGGRTRLVSIFQSLALLAATFVLASVMSQIPLSALAGVLVVTAWRMNDWHSIKFYFSHKIKAAIIPFLATMFATFCLDLTEAIIIGTFISALIFVTQAAKINISIASVDSENLVRSGISYHQIFDETKIVYLSGLLFFAASGHLYETLSDLKGSKAVILSMRGVPQIDTSCVEVLEKLRRDLISNGGIIVFAGISDAVAEFFKISGFFESIGDENFFWSTDQALRVLPSRMIEKN